MPAIPIPEGEPPDQKFERLEIQPSSEATSFREPTICEGRSDPTSPDRSSRSGKSTACPKGWTESVFGDLAALVRDHRAALEPHLMTRAVRPSADRFAAWHAAFWTGGTVLYVPRDVQIDEPLHSLIGLAQAQAADFSHTLVILEAGTSATLLEETASSHADTPGLHVGAVELLIGADAALRYVQLQNWNARTYHFAHQAGHVDRHGRLQWTVGGLGSRLAHIHQHVSLDGPGAEAQVNGVTFATDRQRFRTTRNKRTTLPIPRATSSIRKCSATRRASSGAG